LRLVGHQAEHHAGDKRAALECQQGSSQQPERQESILAVGQIDQCAGKRDRQPKRIAFSIDRPHHGEIRGERDGGPYEQ